MLGIQALPLLGQVRLSRSVGPDLMPAPYLLSRFLSAPSFLLFVLFTSDYLSPIVRSEHHFFQPWL